MKNAFFYFGFIMAIAYLLIGMLFLFTPFLTETIAQNRAILGSVFIIYGIFRVIVSIQKMKRAKRDEV